MQPGDLIGDRFELQRLAGSGGMGEVFRAHDRATGQDVAVKVLAQASREHARFEREARALAELQHPGIVRYVQHGLTAQGEPFLAMEWLEGEDLQRVLQEQRLTVEQTVLLGKSVAEALGAAHAMGVIHRDLKPSNLFLVDRNVERVKVLDFGIARFGGVTRMTQTGKMLGTPGYMAPEQARGDATLTPAVDVFSLGCVLFECLTGVQLFGGEHLMAVLAKILFRETPRVIDLCPDVPPALDTLIDWMLARDPAERPHHAAAVLAELEALRKTAAHTGAPLQTVHPLKPPASLTESEQRVLSVVLIGNPHPLEPPGMPPEMPARVPEAENQLRKAAEAYGGHFEMLVDGSIAVTIGGAGIATDRAALAARCACFLRLRSTGKPIALATGRAEVVGKRSLSDAIDRAARRLTEIGSAYVDADQPGDSLPPIAIDDVTAGLLDAKFDVRPSATGPLLYGEHDLAEGARMLLGKPSPCVGRDRELGTLGAIFAECVNEPKAQVVLVTAQAGIGKSRLAHEYVRTVRQQSETIEIWLGMGDVLRTSSPFALLGQALRGACRILEGESIEVRRTKLRARVGWHVAAGDQKRISEFLGELIGIPFPAEDSPALSAARQEPELMNQQMRAAWQDFLTVECQAHPVLLMLENLHWGDLPTVRFVDVALRALHDQPFMVLALARPEVHEVFPKLWADRGTQEIRLKELTRKASERLVRQVLGDSVGADTRERLVTQAAGHAFYLEELIRAAAAGNKAALPETVVAMVQSRLECLEGDARRLLRAASIFGEAFWQGAVAALLGGTPRSAQSGYWLSALVDRELLLRKPESRFPGEVQFAFRHALLREGAYAMLTPDDRILGHRLAAEWLLQHGESDAMVLAGHFERGHDPIRAAAHYLRAAEQASRSMDLGVAVAHMRRKPAHEPPNVLSSGLLDLFCHPIGRRAGPDAAAAGAMAAKEPLGSTPVVSAAQQASERFLGRLEAFVELVSSLAEAAFFLVFHLRFALLASVVERQHTMLRPVAEHDSFARACLHSSGAFCDAWGKEDYWSALQKAQAARENYRDAGHPYHAQVTQVWIGIHYQSLGDFIRAERELSGARDAHDELGPAHAFWMTTWAELQVDRGLLEEACRSASHVVEEGRSQQLAGYEGHGHWILAEAHRRMGNLDAAEQEIRAALDLLVPLNRLAATTTLAAVQLVQGRTAEALATAENTMIQYETARAFGFKGAFARLVHAEALLAAGRLEEACHALSIARDRLLANAFKIGDPELRRSFLEIVPENARTLELARQWLEQPA